MWSVNQSNHVGKSYIKGSVVDQLIYASGNIDVYVINAQPDTNPAKLSEDLRPHQPFWRYFLGVGLVFLITLIGHFIKGNLEPVNLVMLYLVSTVITAVFLGRGPALFTSVLSVLAFDFFLVPPYLTFAVTDTQYLLTFIGLFLVSLVISTLTARTREQAEAAIQREEHTSALYTLSRDLASATDLHQVAEIIVTHISQAFGRDVVVFLPENGSIKVYADNSQLFSR